MSINEIIQSVTSQLHCVFTCGAQPLTPLQRTKAELKKIQEHLKRTSIDAPGIKDEFRVKLLSFWPQIKALSSELHTLSPAAKKAFTHQISEALFTLGECYYAVNFDLSRKFYIAASMMETGSEAEQVRIMNLDLNFESNERMLLTNLQHQLSQLPELEAFVDGSSVDVFMQRVNPENGLHIGRIYRKMGHCYQNMDSFSSKTEENIKRFETIYGISREAINISHDPDANWEMIELVYNTVRFMWSLTTDYTSLQKVLMMNKELRPLLAKEGTTERALAKQAQVLNIENMALADAQQLCTNPQDAKDIAEARWENQLFIYKIAQQLHNKMNCFLQYMHYHNTASVALTENRLSLAEIRAILNPVEQYMVECNYEHAYFPIFLTTMGKLSLKEGKRAEAVDYFAKTMACYQVKHPEEKKDLANFEASLAKQGLWEDVKAHYDWAVEVISKR